MGGPEAHIEDVTGLDVEEQRKRSRSFEVAVRGLCVSSRSDPSASFP
ncbi:hypothetical protein [Halosolutus halophilus]|nr:hypothetical protein [Halosolutus halophilus]